MNRRGLLGALFGLPLVGVASNTPEEWRMGMKAATIVAMKARTSVQVRIDGIVSRDVIEKLFMTFEDKVGHRGCYKC